MIKPERRPECPNFSSGPCAKRPGWNIAALADSITGRSHRSKPGKARLKEVIDLSREVLGIPADYLCGIVPASDTGAVEMAMWSLLGERGVDLFAWESFGSEWVFDAISQLNLGDCRSFTASYGELPDFTRADFARDVVLTWNGTTSGVKLPNGDFIPDVHEGLVIADSTSAVFAMELPWQKLDVVTWSWQKVMGGEGAHGMIVLSPRAVKRLETYTPPRPLPKIFRLTNKGKLIKGIFEGDTINTPSMIAVEDAVDGLKWAKSIGGLDSLIARSEANLKSIANWVKKSDWIDFLAVSPEICSNTSICLKITDPWYCALSEADQSEKAKKIVSLLDSEGVAFDIGSYRDAPSGLRIWGGSTVENSDIEALLPWLDWAFHQVKGQ